MESVLKDSSGGGGGSDGGGGGTSAVLPIELHEPLAMINATLGQFEVPTEMSQATVLKEVLKEYVLHTALTKLCWRLCVCCGLLLKTACSCPLCVCVRQAGYGY